MRENINRWTNMIWAKFCSKSSPHLWSFLWQRLHRQWSLSLHFCDSEHIKLREKAFLHLRDIQLRAAAIFHAPLTAIKHSRVWHNCAFSGKWKTVDETKMHGLWLFCESWHSPVEAAVVGGQSQVGCFVREPGWHRRWELSSWRGDSFKVTELQWKWKWRKMWWNWLSI